MQQARKECVTVKKVKLAEISHITNNGLQSYICKRQIKIIHNL